MRDPGATTNRHLGSGSGPVLASLAAWAGATLSSLCCLLPLLVIVLGLGSGAFMATTMSYRWILLPAGVVGVIGGCALHVRERRRCGALGCRVAGGRAALGLLILASLVVATAIALDRLPEVTSDLIAALTEGGAPGGHGAGGPR
jgi:hypothetical protein